MIFFQCFFQSAHDLTLMFVFCHIDKIKNDNATQVSQTQLPGNRLCGFEIGFKYSFFKIAITDKCACIDINRGHCLGLVDNQIATRFQVYFFLQASLDFIFNIMQIEYRSFARIVFDQIRNFWHILTGKLLHSLKCLARINPNLLKVFINHVAQHAQIQR